MIYKSINNLGENPRNVNRRLPERNRNEGGDRNRGNRNERDNSSEGSNWVKNLRDKLVQAGILNEADGAVRTNYEQAKQVSQGLTTNGSSQVLTPKGSSQILTTNGAAAEISQEVSKVVSLFDKGAQVSNKSGMLFFNVVLDGPFSFPRPQIVFNNVLFTSEKVAEGLKAKFQRKELVTFSIMQVVNGELIKAVNDFLKRNGPPELKWATGDNGEDYGLGLEMWEGPPPGFEKPIYLQNQVSSQNNTILIEEVEQGPPLGFDKPIYLSQQDATSEVFSQQEDSYHTSPFTVMSSKQPEEEKKIVQGRKKKGKGSGQFNSAQVRRSERLKKKLSVENSNKNSVKKKLGKQYGVINKLKLDYLQSLNPLDTKQAEMVITMAGVQLKGGIEEEVNKMIWN